MELHMRPNTTKILEENLGNTSQNIGFSKYFMTTTPKAAATTAEIDTWNLIYVRASTQQKKLNGVNWQPTEWAKIFATTHLTMG